VPVPRVHGASETQDSDESRISAAESESRAASSSGERDSRRFQALSPLFLLQEFARLSGACVVASRSEQEPLRPPRAAMSDQSSAPPSAAGYAPQRDAPAPPLHEVSSPPPPFGVEPLIHAPPPRQRLVAPALNEPPAAAPGASLIQVWVEKGDRKLQRFHDRVAPYQLYRWLFLGMSKAGETRTIVHG
jgi:hypothetical protein